MEYKKIHQLCDQLGISVYQLADLIKVSRAGLYKMIQNESLRVDVLESIADQLGVSPAVFFSDHVEKVDKISEENQRLKKLLMESYVRLWALWNMDVRKIQKNFLELLLEDSPILKELRENDRFQSLSSSLKSLLNDEYLPELLSRLNHTLGNPKLEIRIDEVKEVPGSTREEDWGLENNKTPMESQKGKK